MTDLLIRGGTVITMDGRRRVISDGAVAITAGRIEAVGPAAELPQQATEVIDARGHAVLPGDPAFTELVQQFPRHPGTRAVIVVDVERIADSCGYAVPRMDYVADRDVLDLWSEKKGPDGIAAYWAKHNALSLDGLPGLD